MDSIKPWPMKNIIILAFTLILAARPFYGLSQCKSFTKDVCIPKLNPYIYNGQLNSAQLNEGDVAELMLTFYSNQDYRIAVCGQNNLGKIQFNLLDVQRNLIFSNKDHNFSDTWDFTSNSSQQLIIEIIVPEGANPEKIESGCVSILVGFLDKK